MPLDRPATRSFPHPVPLSAYWFALSVQTSALLVIALPERLLRLAPSRHVEVLATLAALGAVVSMVVPPTVGHLSDRRREAGVRRRGLILFGSALNVTGLVGTMEAHTVLTLTATFIIAMVGQNGALAAYEALIPEVVPPEGWGRASGSMGVATLLGSIVGLGTSGVFGGRWGFVVMIMTVVVAAAFTATVKEAPRSLAVPRREHRDRRDFSLTFAARFLVMFGLALLMTFVLYFFRDVLGAPNPGMGTALVAGTALVGAASSSLAMGHLSDRYPRSRVVALSGIPMTLAASGFALFPSERILLPLAVFYGLGYGGFLASDWALALASLPEWRHTARDLGIWGIASNLPSVLAPAVGGWLLLRYTDAATGYRVLFLLSGLSFLLGSLVVTAVGRRGPSLPKRAIMVALALVLLAYVRLVHRFRVIGDIPRRGPSTLTVANHQQDLEGMVLPGLMYLAGPLRLSVHSAGGEAMFEPGFLAERAPRWLGWLVDWIPLAPILRWLGVLPIQNEPRHRSIVSLASEILDACGDRPVGDVFTAGAMADLGRRSGRSLEGRRVRDLLRPPFRRHARTPLSLSVLTPAYRRCIRHLLRDRLTRQMEAVRDVLTQGGSLYLTPEGQISKDGSLGRFKELLSLVLPAAREVLAAGIAYEPLAPGRLRLLVHIVRANPREIRAEVLRARPITVDQVLATALLSFEGAPFDLGDVIREVCRLVTEIPAQATVEPPVERWGRVLDRTIHSLIRRGFLHSHADGTLELTDRRQDPRFPLVQDMLSYQRAVFLEAIEAWGVPGGPGQEARLSPPSAGSEGDFGRRRTVKTVETVAGPRKSDTAPP